MQISAFAGSAWEWNDQRQQFYLHQFTVGQPDLDYRNPLVLQEMKVFSLVESLLLFVQITKWFFRIFWDFGWKMAWTALGWTRRRTPSSTLISQTNHSQTTPTALLSNSVSLSTFMSWINLKHSTFSENSVKLSNSMKPKQENLSNISAHHNTKF